MPTWAIEDVRSIFCEAAARCADLLGRPEVAEHWDDPSVLAEFSVSGLAGHMLRATRTVEMYLDGPMPDNDPISGPAYYHALAVSPDASAAANLAIRSRGEEAAAGGPAALAEESRHLLERLVVRVAAEPADRRVRVTGDLVLTLDEYLRTRIVELVVHGEDLALSVGVVPQTEPAAAGVAIDTLVAIARLRHGDAAVLAALARRERDVAGALRVL